jgi:hypothetical protein
LLAIVAHMSDMLLPLVDTWRASVEHGVGTVDPHPIEQCRRCFEPMWRLEGLRYESRQPGSTV